MNKLYFGIIGWLVAAGAAQADNAIIPIDAINGSIAPYVDTDGYVNPIFSLGDIDFGSGLTLPLDLNFTSAIRSPSPEFGQGWECPLFEAKIYDVQQNIKKVSLLGGKYIYLINNPRTDTWRHAYSDNWKGRAKGEDDFDLTYVSGCKFSFHKGLISSMTTPDGRTILWNREGDKLVSMSESGKSPAMQLVYDNLGFAQQILLNPDNLGVAKKTYDFNSNLVYAGIDKIQCPGGRTIVLTRDRDKLLNPILSWTDTKHLPLTVSWDVKTGKIISDSQYTYQIVGGDYPRMLRKNKVTGIAESFTFDVTHGIYNLDLADGTHRRIEIIQAPGPNYKMVRLIEDTKNGKTQIVVRRAFDEQGHLVEETMGLAKGREQVKQYVYDDAGRVVSYLLNGNEMWKNIYDPATGQLKERDVPGLGVKLAFDQLPGGQVKESIEKTKGAVTATKTLEPSAWQAAVTSMQRTE